MLHIRYCSINTLLSRGNFNFLQRTYSSLKAGQPQDANIVFSTGGNLELPPISAIARACSGPESSGAPDHVDLVMFCGPNLPFSTVQTDLGRQNATIPASFRQSGEGCRLPLSSSDAAWHAPSRSSKAMRRLRRSCASDSACPCYLFAGCACASAGSADLDLANELVTLVGAGRELVAEIGLPVLLGPACLDIFLASFRRRPVGRHGLIGDHLLVLFLDRLFWRLHDARVAACDIAMPGQLKVDRVKHGLAGPSLDQAFLERPDRRAVGNLAAGAQTDKALEAQTIEQLEFHLLVAQVEQLLYPQYAHHQFGGKRRATAALPAGPGRCMIDRFGKRREVDMLVENPQGVAELVEHRFALLVGKHAGFDHGNQVRVGPPRQHHARTGEVFR